MKEVLKNNNLKGTKARRVILDIVTSANLPISADNIHKLALKRGAINLSTVYRTLKTLCGHGVLINQIMHDKKAYYQVNNLAHKHILICTECKNQTPIQDCPLHYIEEKIENELGFLITGHNLELLGLCKKCQRARLS